MLGRPRTIRACWHTHEAYSWQHAGNEVADFTPVFATLCSTCLLPSKTYRKTRDKNQGPIAPSSRQFLDRMRPGARCGRSRAHHGPAHYRCPTMVAKNPRPVLRGWGVWTACRRRPLPSPSQQAEPAEQGHRKAHMHRPLFTATLVAVVLVTVPASLPFSQATHQATHRRAVQELLTLEKAWDEACLHTATDARQRIAAAVVLVITGMTAAPGTKARQRTPSRARPESLRKRLGSMPRRLAHVTIRPDGQVAIGHGVQTQTAPDDPGGTGRRQSLYPGVWVERAGHWRIVHAPWTSVPAQQPARGPEDPHADSRTLCFPHLEGGWGGVLEGAQPTPSAGGVCTAHAAGVASHSATRAVLAASPPAQRQALWACSLSAAFACSEAMLTALVVRGGAAAEPRQRLPYAQRGVGPGSGGGGHSGGVGRTATDGGRLADAVRGGRASRSCAP